MKRIDENHSFNINVATILGHVEKAILLKEIYGWCAMNKIKGRNVKNGIPFTYMSAEDYAGKFPYMNAKSVSRWLKQLESEGWIYSGVFNKVAYDRTKWYTINATKYEDAILKNLHSISQNEKWKTHIEESISQNEQPIPSPTTSPKTSQLSLKEKNAENEIEEVTVPKSLEQIKLQPNYPTSFTDRLVESVEAYFEMRKNTGYPFTNVASMNAWISSIRLKVIEYGENETISAIMEAISNQWRSVYIKRQTPKAIRKTKQSGGYSDRTTKMLKEAGMRGLVNAGELEGMDDLEIYNFLEKKMRESL